MAPSRLSRKKQKGDKALNWAIGVVSALILIIGGIILISLLKSPGSGNTASNTTPQHNQGGVHSKKSNATGNSSGGHMASNSSSDSSSGSGSSANSNNNSNSSSSNNGQSSSDKNNSSSSSSSTSENVPDSQHTASYDQGSADWNAQVAALSQATGIPQDQMTVWWLGNGGSPNTSIGRVSNKQTPDQKYVVKLEYKNKHWQASDVQKP